MPPKTQRGAIRDRYQDTAAAERRASRREQQQQAREERVPRFDTEAVPTTRSVVPAFQPAGGRGSGPGGAALAMANNQAVAQSWDQAIKNFTSSINQPRAYPAGGPGSGPGGAALAMENNRAFADAVRNAFGMTPMTPTNTPFSSPQSRRRFDLNDFVSPGYQVPDVSKTVTERYQDWVNSVPNSALGYESYLFPTEGFASTDNIPRGGGGGGYYSGGGGGGGGGGYSPGGGAASNYNAWLRGILTRWNFPG